MTWRQILLKNSFSNRKLSFQIRKCFSCQNVDIAVSVHHSFHRYRRPNTFPSEAPLEHLFLQMFDRLVDASSRQSFSSTFSNKLNVFAFHKKVTFISKQDVLPVICIPAFVLLCPIISFLFHAIS